MSARAQEFEEWVKRLGLRFYKEKGIKLSCERCFYLVDPNCPDFPHVCSKDVVYSRIS